MLCVRKTDLGSWPLWTQYLHKPYDNSVGVDIDYMLKLVHFSTQASTFWRRDYAIFYQVR
jgi:hypothetical protein